VLFFFFSLIIFLLVDDFFAVQCDFVVITIFVIDKKRKLDILVFCECGCMVDLLVTEQVPKICALCGVFSMICFSIFYEFVFCCLVCLSVSLLCGVFDYEGNKFCI
jgi:hypothetical protein